MPSISASRTSPPLIGPTPDGVPVKIMSPGKSVANVEAYARPSGNSMVSRKVDRTHFALYGTKAYFDAFGVPAKLADLSRHFVIENINLRTNRALAEWQTALSKAPASVAANASATVLATVRAGGGVALLPTFFEAAAPELIMLDIPLKLTSDIWMLSDTRTNKTPRVRALMNFIVDRFARDRARWFF
jgi:DNA-binding transcriptional LysR family regulator